MRVGFADNFVSDLAKRFKSSRAAVPKRVRTPNCTHINMDRVYGRGQVCYVCGREPAVGFLYVCRQDHTPDPPACEPLASRQEHTEHGTVPKSQLRQELEDIGLSESVILTAERGEYTAAQLEKLKAQKLELKQAISDAIQGYQANAVHANLTNSSKGPSNNDGASSSAAHKNTGPPACNFKACHTCRPYYKDRIYISFSAVLSNQFTPVTPAEATLLPTKPAANLRSIGLLPSPLVLQGDTNTSPSTLPTCTDFSTELARTPSRASIVTFKTTQTDMDELSRIRRPRHRFYHLGQRDSGDIAQDLTNLPLFSRQGLKSAIQGIFRPSRDSSSSGSNITLPLPRTGTARGLTQGKTIGEFDIGALRRVRRQKERNDLQNGTYIGGFEGVGSELRRRAASMHAEADEDESESDFTVYSCASEGSEVEVEGGVALTEEAVETHTPDILRAGSIMANGLDVSMGGEESIMTQV